MSGRCLQLLRCLGPLVGLLCVLAGCGGNGGSSSTSGTVSRGRPLSLQFQLSSQLSSQAVSAARHEGRVAAQVRQVQPGDPGFIERLEIRLQAQGSDLVPPQVFTLDATEQETVTLEVMVPDIAPATFQVLVSAFNPQGIEVFRGDTSVAFGQTNAVVTLLRAALVPVPATPANLQQTTFVFADGAIFGLAKYPGHSGNRHVCGQCRRFCFDSKWLGGDWQPGDWLVHLAGGHEHFPCRAGSPGGGPTRPGAVSN